MLPVKVFSSQTYKEAELPNLLSIQKDSYNWFWEKGLRTLLDEISPIKDFSGKELEVYFGDYKLGEPKYTEVAAKKLNASYEAALRVSVKLHNKKTGEIKEQEVYLGDFPLMTTRGTFIVNGIERVLISQLIRSPGIVFTSFMVRGIEMFGAKVIPNRGAWLEFDVDYSGVINVKIDRKRKIAATSMLRLFGLSDADIRKTFRKVSSNSEIDYIERTLKSDPSSNVDEAYLEIYKRIRPGDLATSDNAKSLIDNMFFNFDRYDFSHVGRWKSSQRLHEALEGIGIKTPKVVATEYSIEDRILKKEDILGVIAEIIKMNNDPDAKADDIDHLGSRRVRSIGELLQNRLRVGLTRMERNIKDRMSTLDISTVTPIQLINARPVASIVREFFTTGQLSQYMDNPNPLAELEHKRILSATGPGGLTRERAGFEVRDVQPSHYGRICPIQTPEGPNVGIVTRLASYARINNLGFLETPYFVINNGKITGKVEYLNALQEERSIIASSATKFDSNKKIANKQVQSRVRGVPTFVDRKDVNYIDISPRQMLSVAAALIPFIEHDDANRAMMGSNMQRQAVPCIRPEPPLVGTGLEEKVARDSGLIIIAEKDGIIEEVDGKHITVRYKGASLSQKGQTVYDLNNFVHSNQYTVIHQIPKVKVGQKIKEGDVLADTSSVKDGVLALGKNILVAFMPWRGGNFEDAVLISEKLVKEDTLSSIHLEDFSIDVRETKLGAELNTPDIPNVSQEKLKDLDEEGIIRIGAEVDENDILVGKISPKGEADLTSEERLLRAIFGEKSRDVKDTSLRLSHGKRGRVVGVTIFEREDGASNLPTGVIRRIRVDVAQLRKIEAGDKVAGRHGNKGVISRVMPEEDMPFLPDGTPIDIILNPLGVPSRMNIGQILETHLSLAANKLGYRAVTPSFSGATEEQIREELKKAGFPETGKIVLRDGHTGEEFEQEVTVGYMYILKLIHMVEDKIHMRSTGPYSLITQQPLGGKSQFGGQRFGEMEVWALEGYGAAHNLQEMLTIKSDDVMGRSAAYESIIKGEEIKKPNIPESFNVLVNELKGLGLNVLLEEEE